MICTQLILIGWSN